MFEGYSGGDQALNDAISCLSAGGYLEFEDAPQCDDAMIQLNGAIEGFNDGTLVDCSFTSPTSTPTTSATTSQSTSMTTSMTTTITSSITTTPTTTILSQHFTCAAVLGVVYVVASSGTSNGDCVTEADALETLLDACATRPGAPLLSSLFNGDLSCKEISLSGVQRQLLVDVQPTTCLQSAVSLNEMLREFTGPPGTESEFDCAVTSLDEPGYMRYPGTEAECLATTGLLNDALHQFSSGDFTACVRTTVTTTQTTTPTSTETTSTSATTSLTTSTSPTTSPSTSLTTTETTAAFGRFECFTDPDTARDFLTTLENGNQKECDGQAELLSAALDACDDGDPPELDCEQQGNGRFYLKSSQCTTIASTLNAAIAEYTRTSLEVKFECQLGGFLYGLTCSEDYEHVNNIIDS